MMSSVNSKRALYKWTRTLVYARLIGIQSYIRFDVEVELKKNISGSDIIFKLFVYTVTSRWANCIVCLYGEDISLLSILLR